MKGGKCKWSQRRKIVNYTSIGVKTPWHINYRIFRPISRNFLHQHRPLRLVQQMRLVQRFYTRFTYWPTKSTVWAHFKQTYLNTSAANCHFYSYFRPPLSTKEEEEEKHLRTVMKTWKTTMKWPGSWLVSKGHNSRRASCRLLRGSVIVFLLLLRLIRRVRPLQLFFKNFYEIQGMRLIKQCVL